jgi:hypothetical protein
MIAATLASDTSNTPKLTVVCTTHHRCSATWRCPPPPHHATHSSVTLHHRRPATRRCPRHRGHHCWADPPLSKPDRGAPLRTPTHGSFSVFKNSKNIILLLFYWAIRSPYCTTKGRLGDFFKQLHIEGPLCNSKTLEFFTSAPSSPWPPFQWVAKPPVESTARVPRSIKSL